MPSNYKTYYQYDLACHEFLGLGGRDEPHASYDMSHRHGLARREVVSALLAGDTVAAQPVKGKRVTVRLPTPAGRRLFEALLHAPPQQRAEPGDALFGALITAYQAENDPAAGRMTAASDGPPANHCWELETIECHNFGGLNLFGGADFTFDVAARNWSLEGQNGSGKSSLVGAILFALTGTRVRDQVGPTSDVCRREPVLDPEGRAIGSWPPVVAYPPEARLLGGDAETWVRLTFRDARSDATAIAYRRFVSPVDGNEAFEEVIDPRLLVAPGLIETGLLMPARIAEIGFGDRSASLFDAVKALTGLDELAEIGELAGALSNRARRFLKYEKDQRIEVLEADYGRLAEEILKLVPDAGLDRTALETPDYPGGGRALKEVAARFRTAALTHLKALQEDLAPGLELEKDVVQDRVRDAVAQSRKTIQTGPKALSVFRQLGSLTDEAAHLRGLNGLADDAERNLADAIRWHGRQQADVKLRLKALAAQWFEPPAEGQPANCPLCDAELVTDGQRHLVKELEELKAEAEAAERRLDAACDALSAELLQGLPLVLRHELDRLGTLDPPAAVADELRDVFVGDAAYSACLVGAMRVVEAELSARMAGLPRFACDHQPLASDPALPKVDAVRRRIAAIRRTLALAEWWQAHKATYWEFWKAVIGTMGADGTLSDRGLAGHIGQLSKALSRAEPYRKAAEKLDQAAGKAVEWGTIKVNQRLRESIVEEIAPLKNLRALVDAETGRSIATLSDRVSVVLDRIHLRGGLTYQETALRRKAVEVKGSFTPGMRIDAALVANTSWLRAILWAFVFALREEALAAHGGNPFPLMVLDDPQTTFDPRNKRSWVRELVRLANLGAEVNRAQVIVTTHEREFYGFFEMEGFSGQMGMLAPATLATGKACIVNGLFFERKWAEAQRANDDAAAREYIRLLRIHVESLLKWMLRADGHALNGGNLDTLRRTLIDLRRDRTPPYDRKSFEALLKRIDGGELHIRLLNEPPHNDDETVGVTEAKRLHEHWGKYLQKALYDAFDEMRCYEAYRGDPRLYPLDAANQNLSTLHAATLRGIDLRLTGIAASAASDGRFRGGWLTLTELSAERTRAVRLVNHDVYRLNAQTLEPVAEPGDLLLVSNMARIGARNLVAAAFGGKFLARRYEELEAHPDLAVLTAQSVDPRRIAEPVLIGRTSANDRQSCKKIVGVLFDPKGWQEGAGDHEFIDVSDASVCRGLLDGMRLFQVDGRSAEPTALDGQFLVAGEALREIRAITLLDGRPVIAGDVEGRHCFKRLRLVEEKLVVLESLDMSGHEPPLVWSLDDIAGRTRLASVRAVHGVLFELPEGGAVRNEKADEDMLAGA